MEIEDHMETCTAAQAIIATTTPLGKDRMTSTTMTGTTGVTDPITTGESLKPYYLFCYVFLNQGTIMSKRCS